MENILIRGLNKFGVLKYVNSYGSISLNGKLFKIPILGQMGFSNLFISEPWMIDVLKIVLPIENKKFIDVGVNIGQTLLKLRAVSEDIAYIGFEPNAQCINYVTRLIKKNKIDKTTILPVGISNKTELGQLNFFEESVTDSSASMIAEFRPKERVLRTAYIPLFDLKKIRQSINFDNLSVMKIDVEGAELEVLTSFYQEINEQKPILLLEILPVYKKQNSARIERQNEVQRLLKEMHYTMFRVIKQKEALVGFTEIDEIGIHANLNDCDYVMVPDIKRDLFQKYGRHKILG